MAFTATTKTSPAPYLDSGITAVNDFGPPGGRSRQTSPSTDRLVAVASCNHLACHTIPLELAMQTVLVSSLPGYAIDQWKKPLRPPCTNQLAPNRGARTH